jgi:hypothetical protein
LIVLLALDASGNALYQLSEYAEWFLTLAAFGIAAEVGYWLGRRAKAQSPTGAEATQEHTQGVETAVFALLGLLLAFTYSLAISRFDDCKMALTQEVSAIEVAYERTQVLPADLQTSEAALLRQYVDVRLASARPNWYLDTALKAKTHVYEVAKTDNLFVVAAVIIALRLRLGQQGAFLVTAGIALPRVPALLHRYTCYEQRSDGVCPPPAKEGVCAQADEQRH